MLLEMDSNIKAIKDQLDVNGKKPELKTMNSSIKNYSKSMCEEISYTTNNLI